MQKNSVENTNLVLKQDKSFTWIWYSNDPNSYKWWSISKGFSALPCHWQALKVLLLS